MIAFGLVFPPVSGVLLEGPEGVAEPFSLFVVA